MGTTAISILQMGKSRRREVWQLAGGPTANQQPGQDWNPGGMVPEFSSTMEKVPLTLLTRPDAHKVLVSSGEHMGLGTGKGCTIRKMLLFLMTNETAKGVSVSSREQTVLQGGSILTAGVWLALLRTESLLLPFKEAL